MFRSEGYWGIPISDGGVIAAYVSWAAPNSPRIKTANNADFSIIFCPIPIAPIMAYYYLTIIAQMASLLRLSSFHKPIQDHELVILSLTTT